jgi:hypothetical protein
MTFTLLSVTACSSKQTELHLGEEQAEPQEAQYVAEMIEAIKIISLQRDPDNIVRRFNQRKTLACFDGTMTINNNLEEELQQGIFAKPGSYPVQLRFANATKMDDTEKDFRGLSIKVHQVSGEPLWGDPGQQDFLFNSHPALFAANPADFNDFIQATKDKALWRYFINPSHFYSLGIVLRGRDKIDNPFAINYWSTTPFRHGLDSESAVKYSVRPCPNSVPSQDLNQHKDFLADAMREHLRQSPACFNFMLQWQTDPVAMPIEDASVAWSEADSPFISIATIEVKDNGTSDVTRQQCEAMSFSPWQSLAEHQPLGGINRARLPIYSEISIFRQQQNQQRLTP